ncbi:MAG: hypothetical protein ABEI06_10900 [Halobacteriaceae archaeon]
MAKKGMSNLMEALNVRFLAVTGFSLALVLTVGIFYVFLTPRIARPSVYYYALGFVFFISSGLLFTVIFTVIAAIRLIRSFE